MATDDLGILITLYTLSAGVPTCDDPVGVQHENCVVRNAFNHMLKASFRALPLLSLFKKLLIRGRQFSGSFRYVGFKLLLIVSQDLFGALAPLDLFLCCAVKT